MAKTKTIISLALLPMLTACMPRNTEPPMTQMEVRVIQSREFDTPNLKLVMKTMMNVLQDEGYIIKNAVSDLGLLTAEKQINVEDKAQAFLLCCLAGERARWCKQKVLEASANVSEYGTKTKIRINFQIKTFDNAGCVLDIIEVKDPEVYQEFFAKVNKGIFLQEEGL